MKNAMLNEDTTNVTLLDLYGCNLHKGLHTILRISKILAVISLIFIHIPQGCVYSLISKCGFSTYLYQIYKSICIFIMSNYIDIFSVILPILFSTIVVFANEKNKLTILQFKILFSYIDKSKIIKGFIFYSFVFAFFIHAKIQGRVGIASISVVSISLILFYVLMYIIRFNTDKTYYHKEFVGSYLRSNEKEREQLLDLILPSIPADYNNCDKDIELLEYLIKTPNIPYTLFTFEGTVLYSEFTTVNKPQELKLVNDIMIELIIPIASRLRRTYEFEASNLIAKIIDRVSNIKHNNQMMNLSLQVFLILMAKELEINSCFSNNLPNSDLCIACQKLMNNGIKYENDCFKDFLQASGYDYDKAIYNLYLIRYTYLRYLQKYCLLSIPQYQENEVRYAASMLIWDDISDQAYLPYNMFDLLYKCK